MRDDVIARVREVVADIFNVSIDDVAGESSPDSIASWDSLLHLNLVTALEQTFDVVFLPEDIESMLTVDAIVDHVRAKRSGAAGSSVAGGPAATPVPGVAA